MKEMEMRIIILGLDNAGKTTIMKKISGEDITEISPTVGFNIQTLEYNGYLLNIWDVGGQKSIRPFWRNYFESTDGIIWVIDSVEKYRLEECKLQLRDILSQEKLAGIYICVLFIYIIISVQCLFSYYPIYIYLILHTTYKLFYAIYNLRCQSINISK